MREVARQAGVSSSAVWAAFRKSDAAATTIGVSEEARQKILAVAARLHYKPDILARSFTNNCSFLLGLLMRETFEDFSMPLLRGIQDICLDHDYSVITYAHGNSAADERRHLKFSQDRRVDGLIVMPALDRDGANNFARLQALRADGLPVVQLFNSLVPGIPAVVRDHEAIGYLATRRLLEIGHRRILHLTFTGYDDDRIKGFHIDAKQRCEGYERAMREAGLEPRVYAHAPLKEGDRQFHDAVLADADVILHHPDAPTAIVPYNDYQAWGLLEACAKHRIRVPEDLSVIGCDSIREMWVGSDRLATFTYPLREMGRAAATLCLDMMKGETPHNVVFPPTYVDGTTIAPRKTRAKATRFTLVELLVVIAIIALLAGLLLPTLGNARERGKRIVCVGNLRSLGVLAQLYASDYADQFPGPWINTPGDLAIMKWGYIWQNEGFPSFLSHYVDTQNLHRFLFCPSARYDVYGILTKDQAMAEPYYEAGYIYTVAMHPGYWWSPPFVPANQHYQLTANVTAGMPLFADMLFREGEGMSNHNSAHLQPGGLLDGINAVYCDGHAKWIPRARFYFGYPSGTAYPLPDGGPHDTAMQPN